MRHQGRIALTVLLALALALAAAACGGSDGGGSGEAAATGNESVSGSVSFMGIWTGEEQASFQAVIDAFNEQFPNVTVKYNPVGDNLPTVLSTAVEGGNPPDLAEVAQPGLIQGFVDQGALKPIDFAKDTMAENFDDSILQVGTFNDALYGLMFKAANKSTIWYNVKAFEDAGVEPPDDWAEAPRRRRRRSRLRACPRTRSAAPTAGRSPTSSRTSISGWPGRRSTTSSPSTRSRGPTSPSRTR